MINISHKRLKEILNIPDEQQLLIKPITTRVAGRSPAKGFILLFVVGLKANCCILEPRRLESRLFKCLVFHWEGSRYYAH